MYAMTRSIHQRLGTMTLTRLISPLPCRSLSLVPTHTHTHSHFDGDEANIVKSVTDEIDPLLSLPSCRLPSSGQKQLASLSSLYRGRKANSSHHLRLLVNALLFRSRWHFSSFTDCLSLLFLLSVTLAVNCGTLPSALVPYLLTRTAHRSPYFYTLTVVSCPLLSSCSFPINNLNKLFKCVYVCVLTLVL